MRTSALPSRPSRATKLRPTTRGFPEPFRVGGTVPSNPAVHGGIREGACPQAQRPREKTAPRIQEATSIKKRGCLDSDGAGNSKGAALEDKRPPTTPVACDQSAANDSRVSGTSPRRWNFPVESRRSRRDPGGHPGGRLSQAPRPPEMTAARIQEVASIKKRGCLDSDGAGNSKGAALEDKRPPATPVVCDQAAPIDSRVSGTLPRRRNRSVGSRRSRRHPGGRLSPSAAPTGKDRRPNPGSHFDQETGLPGFGQRRELEGRCA